MSEVRVDQPRLRCSACQYETTVQATSASNAEQFMMWLTAPAAHCPGSNWLFLGTGSTVQGKPRRAEWDEVMMAHARAIAMRSKDRGTQVGACVVDDKWTVLGTGFNGFPRGAPDSDLPCEGKAKHLWTLHAEYNASLHAVACRGLDLSGCAVYSTHRPCADCLKRLAHLGIRKFVFEVDQLDGEQQFAAVRVADVLGLYVQPLDLV